MTTTINASTSSGLVNTADTSGILQLQTASTAALTIDASQNVTFAGTQTLSAGTANSVAYLNGSKALTTGSALKFDGTNLGVGTTPPTWFNDYRSIQLAGSVSISGRTTATGLMQMMVNAYRDASANYIYSSTGAAGQYFMIDNQHVWYNAPSGTAGNTISFTENMRIDSSGYLRCPGVYNQTNPNAANVFVGTAGDLYRSTSSLKYKKNIENSVHGLTDLLNLRSVTYQSNNPDNGEQVFGGFIAEEVHDAGLTEFVQYAEDGSPDALAYGNMVALCVKAIQELKAINDTQAETINALTARIVALESK